MGSSGEAVCRRDSDRPYIAHVFHDSEHPDIVNRDNRSQNILRTAATNEIRMEDLREQEHTTTRELHDDELRSKVTDRAILNAARVEHQMTTGSEQ